MKRKLSRWLPMVLSILIVCSMGMSVFAADGDIIVPDLNKTGSISVVLKELENKEPVVDVELILYQVATAGFDDGDAVYAYTDEFSDCEYSLDKIDSEELAKKFAAYVSEKKLEGKPAVTDANGKVSFENLKTGLYLIMQNKVSEDYTTAKPFLVSVPMLVKDTYIYDVDASPKVDQVSKKETETETETETEPSKPDKPVKPGKPSTGNKLPQTGQLWWPVCLLTVAGVLSFVYGWTRKKKISE